LTLQASRCTQADGSRGPKDLANIEQERLRFHGFIFLKLAAIPNLPPYTIDNDCHDHDPSNLLESVSNTGERQWRHAMGGSRCSK